MAIANTIYIFMLYLATYLVFHCCCLFCFNPSIYIAIQLWVPPTKLKKEKFRLNLFVLASIK